MENYEAVKEIGSGTFGSVWRAVNKQSGEVVAVKVLKKRYSSWVECLNLREVECLRKLKHSNIVKLKELVWEKETLYFVFEHMESNLHQIIASRKQPFSEAVIREWCFQVFQGLNYMHQQGYLHRDLKPDNLLVTKDIIKIADFGQAKEINSRPPYTERISTPWYRAPELVLHSRMYTSKVDMWAMGAVMAELFTLRPLFPGTNGADEIYKMCSVLGCPTIYSWADGLRLAKALNFQFPQLAGVNLSALMPSASENAISLIRSLCSWNPCKRPTASEALQHPFFHSCFYVPQPLRSIAAVAKTTQSPATRGMLQQQVPKMYSGALPNSMLDSNFSFADLSTGMQHISANQLEPARIVHGVSDADENYANTMIASHRQYVSLLKMPAIKTGEVWNGESAGDLFLRQMQFGTWQN